MNIEIRPNHGQVTVIGEYTKEDIETLRQKLIEDIENEEHKITCWAEAMKYGSINHSIDKKTIIKIINKRFGVKK